MTTAQRTGGAALTALLLLSCGGQGAPEISIEHGWTREVAPGQASAAVYMTIANGGGGADRLVSAASSASDGASLHSSSSAGGIIRMRPIDSGLDIPAGSTVELKPSGTHVMLTGLKKRLSPGETVNLELRFARSGARPVAIRVVPINAGDDHSGHGMAM